MEVKLGTDKQTISLIKYEIEEIKNQYPDIEEELERIQRKNDRSSTQINIEYLNFKISSVKSLKNT